MGAINYCTSNYITLGVKPLDPDLYDEQELETEYICLAEMVTDLLKRYDFYYFYVAIKWGYYEGFSIFIENNFGLCYDCYHDKKEAQKEATLLKDFLISACSYGLVKCVPGWCPAYYTEKETYIAIKEAIKEIREEIKNTPTWYRYKKDENIA